MAEPFRHTYKVDLNEPLKRFDVGEILASGDEKANSFEVTVCRNGFNVDLTGCAVYGYFIRPNEETMKVDGTVNGNVACVELSKSCYVYDGAFSLAIKVTGNGITQTVAVFDGLIVRTTSENIVDGNRVLYGLEDLLAQIAATEAAAVNANTAAGNAESAAGMATKAAADANKWANANATATAISAESQPTVEVDEVDGKKVIAFGIPAGKTPNITFRVSTGAPGTQVEIQQSGTPEAPVVDLTIPRGDTGAIDGLDYFEGNPSALGDASSGTANGVARGDHVHPMPTAENVGALPVGGTAANADKLDNKSIADIMLMHYYEGCIYISANETSPASLFGGTWERIKDKFLLAAGDGYIAGATGGEAVHTLTAPETPKVTGRLQFRLGADGINMVGDFPGETNCFTVTNNGGQKWANQVGSSAPASLATSAVAFDNGGQNAPHNNMPPYLAVYIWKRVS